MALTSVVKKVETIPLSENTGDEPEAKVRKISTENEEHHVQTPILSKSDSNRCVFLAISK